MLVAGRVIQGAGAAALSPAAMSLLMLHFPGEQRARAMSLWGAASAVGGATGVLAGGLLAGTFGWSSVFLVTVPASVAAVVLARRVLEDTARGAAAQFDAGGAVTITTAVVALVNGALGAADSRPDLPERPPPHCRRRGLGAGSSPSSVAPPDPLVPLDSSAPGSSRPVSHSPCSVEPPGPRLSCSIALYLQKALTMSPEHAGLAMVPTSVTGFVVNLTVLPRVLRAIGPRRAGRRPRDPRGRPPVARLRPTGLGYAFAVPPGLLLVATGVALSFMPTTMVIASAAPDPHAGLASGLASSATQIGAALGTATLTAIALLPGSRRHGFHPAFTAAAVVAVATAGLALTLVRR